MSETRAAFVPAAALAAKVHELLLAAARVTPQAPAVIDYTDSGELNTMTYRPLESLAVACATEMDRLGPDIGDRVLVEADTRPSDRHVPRLLDARCHLVPVSPDIPDQRPLSVLDTSGAVLHTRAAAVARACLPGSVATERFDTTRLTVERAPTPRTRHRRAAVTTDTAYMISTSGRSASCSVWPTHGPPQVDGVPSIRRPALWLEPERLACTRLVAGARDG